MRNMHDTGGEYALVKTAKNVYKRLVLMLSNILAVGGGALFVSSRG